MPFKGVLTSIQAVSLAVSLAAATCVSAAQRLPAAAPAVKAVQPKAQDAASPAAAAPKQGPQKQKQPVTIISDNMEADKAESVAVFKGNVVAVEDFTMCSNELQVHYGQDREITEITAKGNVRIFQDDKTSTSNHAVYNRKQRTIVLTENPVVKQCTDTVRGDKITVYVDEDKALVESGNGARVRAVILSDRNCQEQGAAKTVTVRKIAIEEARCKRTR